MEQPMVGLPGGFKDRRGGLIGFGILLIAIGCLCALFTVIVAAMVLWFQPASPAAGAMNTRAMVPGVLVYLVLAVACIWLGIGSIKTRRWARALLLIMGWVWLLSGVIALTAMAFTMPKALSHPPPGTASLPAGAVSVVMVFTLLFMFVFFVVVPGALVLFYRSPHVKATCEARDPIPRWTDACPLPVLAMSLMLGWGAVSMLAIIWLNSVVPFFGQLLHGFPGTLVIVVMASLWAYAAWATYRLRPAGWWIVAVGMVVWAASALLTFARVDMLEMYRLMGYPEQQVVRMQQMGIFGGGELLILTAFSVLLVLGYLLYVKKYFRRAA